MPEVQIRRPLSLRARQQVRSCGTTYRYERHVDIHGLALLLRCTCPGGHGIAGLPWRGWFGTSEAEMDLVLGDADVRAA
jgi:hypothetical protein